MANLTELKGLLCPSRVIWLSQSPCLSPLLLSSLLVSHCSLASPCVTNMAAFNTLLTSFQSGNLAGKGTAFFKCLCINPGKNLCHKSTLGPLYPCGKVVVGQWDCSPSASHYNTADAPLKSLTVVAC